MVYNGMKNVLVIRSAVVDWRKYDEASDAINIRRQRKFGTVPDPENKVTRFEFQAEPGTY